MRRFPALLAVISLSVATPTLAAPSAETELAAAERAFAADGLSLGVSDSFQKWAAPDGLVFRMGPVNAREWFARHPSKVGAPPLRWWPVRVGVARSGDLGFDAGPWVIGEGQAHGWFFTIWKRQPDGGWKWVLDHGFEAAPSPLGPATPLSIVGRSNMGAGSAEQAWTQVREEEAALADVLAAGRGYGGRLSREAWVAGLTPQPATTPAEVRAALAARPPIRSELLGGGASRAGDLAYAYGRARWTADGKPVDGHFIRMWRREARAWRVLFDLTTNE